MVKMAGQRFNPRVVANAPVLSHDPKYGGWIDPYEFRVKPKKKGEEV